MTFFAIQFLSFLLFFYFYEFVYLFILLIIKNIFFAFLFSFLPYTFQLKYTEKDRKLDLLSYKKLKKYCIFIVKVFSINRIL